jgi:hypothetical protein
VPCLNEKRDRSTSSRKKEKINRFLYGVTMLDSSFMDRDRATREDFSGQTLDDLSCCRT